MKIAEEWLREEYVNRLIKVEDIAASAGCTVANVRQYLKLWKIYRGKALQKTGLVPAWNAGKTKDTDETLRRMAESKVGHKNSMAGRPAWNRGLKTSDDRRVAAVSAKLAGRVVRSETRERMRVAKLGKVREQANNWKGGISPSGDYFVHRRTVDGRRLYAHRAVAEQFLGRYLTSDEHVHHIDRITANNTPENLIVLLEADHNRLHRAIDSGYESREQQIQWLIENNITFMELI